ncbi:MAG TPA: transglutaminaseTgpA domain-containing protein [Nocardioides sp.]|nr:transglutaminaseTgpA domain-containing protein [Nocardioides sp.]
MSAPGARARAEPVQRTSWVDVVAPFVLTVIALSALEGSYADRSYLVVGALGALTATAVATVARTQRRDRGELLLALLVLFAPVGALFSRHDGDVVTVPGIESMSAVLTDGFTGPGQLLSTIPPADPVGAPLTLTFILGYLVAGVSAGTALYGRRAVLPVMPALLGLVAAILLGVQEPAGVALRAALFALVAIAWSGWRGQRRSATAYAGRDTAVRGLVGVAVVAAVVGLAPVVAGPTSSSAEPRWVLRGQVGKGEDVDSMDNPLSDFRRYTRQLPGTPGNVYNETLFEVDGLPDNVPMRFATLDVYDGTRWRADNRTVEDRADSLFLRIGSEVDAPLSGRNIDVRVTLRMGYVSSWLPLAGQLTRLDFTFLDGRAQREDVRYNPATLTAMVRGGLTRRDDYEFAAVLPPSALKVGMSPYRRGRSQTEGAFLDEALEPWREASLSPMERVFSLAEYLRTNGRFSDGAQSWERQFEAGHDPVRLGEGFFEASQMVGDHEQYTAFMALAANRLGVPARTVVGAVPGPDGVVSGSDVTTWVEIRVKDGSWRILPSDVYLSTRPPRRSEPRKKDPGTFVAEAEEERARKSRPPTTTPERDALEEVAEEPASRTPVVVAAVLLGMVLVASVPALKWWRRRRRSTGSGRDQLAGAWQELLDLLVDLGHTVPPSPRPSQALVLGRGTEAARLADGVFAPGEPSDADVAAIWTLVESERRALLAEHGWKGRVRAWWNPASLGLLTSVRSAARRALSAPEPRAWQPSAGDGVP